MPPRWLRASSSSLVIILDVLAFFVFPPFDQGGQPGDACAFPVCFINGTLEFPAPHVICDLDGSTRA